MERLKLIDEVLFIISILTLISNYSFSVHKIAYYYLVKKTNDRDTLLLLQNPMIATKITVQ
jgi:hypothetical protein